MADRSYTSRRELEEYHFSPVTTLLVPLVLLLLQHFLPKVWAPLRILDLPLLAVVFFAVARRNPISGAVTGAVIGLVQDALTGLPIGINGIAKTLVGYGASSIGVRVDVENSTTRVLIVFGFSVVESLLVFLIEKALLGGRDVRLLWLHELIRAGVNTGVAIPLFLLLDRFKRRE